MTELPHVAVLAACLVLVSLATVAMGLALIWLVYKRMPRPATAEAVQITRIWRDGFQEGLKAGEQPPHPVHLPLPEGPLANMEFGAIARAEADGAYPPPRPAPRPEDEVQIAEFGTMTAG